MCLKIEQYKVRDTYSNYYSALKYETKNLRGSYVKYTTPYFF